MRDRITGKPRGFGFVTFREKDAAERVCREPQILDGRQVSAPWAQESTVGLIWHSVA